MDTATFAHPNATPRTLAVSAALVEAGAQLAEISRRLYRSKPDAQLKLLGRALHRLETAADGRIVWSTLETAAGRREVVIVSIGDSLPTDLPVDLILPQATSAADAAELIIADLRDGRAVLFQA